MDKINTGEINTDEVNTSEVNTGEVNTNEVFINKLEALFETYKHIPFNTITSGSSIYSDIYDTIQQILEGSQEDFKYNKKIAEMNFINLFKYWILEYILIDNKELNSNNTLNIKIIKKYTFFSYTLKGKYYDVFKEFEQKIIHLPYQVIVHLRDIYEQNIMEYDDDRKFLRNDVFYATVGYHKIYPWVMDLLNIMDYREQSYDVKTYIENFEIQYDDLLPIDEMT